MNRVSIFLLLCLFCRLTKCFRGIRYHASVRALDWIYIDGGEILSETGIYNRNNSTCGIDLSKNWTNSSVILTCTERRAKPAIQSEALWFNKNQNSIYCFGGDLSLEPRYTPFQSIWAFTPDGNGTGNWTEVLGPTGPEPFPPGIFPGSRPAVASDGSHGYYFGGFVRGSPTGRAPGLLTVNFTDLTITNDTSIGTADYGQMINVPYYGTSGVLITLGLGTMSSTNTLTFKNITIYDKSKKKWYSQMASGTIPGLRIFSCLAGIRGIESDTFEIFMYGGQITSPIKSPDALYILSIPSFQWFQTEYQPTIPRGLHTCHTTNTNQLIIIGGEDPGPFGINLNNRTGVRDPWAQGIGIFDMTNLKDKDSYEAKAKPYEPPELIKSFYRDKSNRYPAKWTSSAVQELFQIDSLNTTNSQVPKKPINSSTPPSPNLSSVAIAAIATGGVFVGSGILCAIATVSFRKIRKNHTKPSTIRRELPANERQELASNESRELAANESRELAANEREKLAANEHPTELPASINLAELLDHHKNRTELE